MIKNSENGVFADFAKLLPESKNCRVWMSHGDSVSALPSGFEISGSTNDCEAAAVSDFAKKFFGVQFHLEVTHTQFGMEMLDNFLKICKCKKDWSINDFIDDEISRIREKVGDRKVFLMISGGVDSTVCYLMLKKALGDEKVFGLYVDTGFMRLGETEQVSQALKELGFESLHVYNAREEFFGALAGVYEPEEKRKIIGKVFLEIQKKVSESLKLNPQEWLLGQGTIYPDTIESGASKHADKIKTHHNRVAEIEELMKQGLIIEPLSDLYKDEVRQVGLKLGLSEKMVFRHPFPGPGLAVRCLVAAHERKIENQENLEQEIGEFLQNKGFKARVLPILSVGVQGDARSYKHPLAIYGQEIDWLILEKLSTELTNRFTQINRVVLTCNPTQIDDLQIDTEDMSPSKIQILQKVDNAVTEFLWEKNIYGDMWQFPVVLLPVGVNGGRLSVVLRPVDSQEAMTANFHQMKVEHLRELSAKLMEFTEISAVFFDISHKPPGTIEWE
jgi:GMP synthase (glutamine-hydrolysing)